MQIKNKAARQDTLSEKQPAKKNSKTQKTSSKGASAGESSTFSRVAKAFALGVLAGPAAAVAREMPVGASQALALPGHAGLVLANANVAHTSRQLLQSGCPCTLSVETGDTLATAGTGYTNISMRSDLQRQGNTILFTALGSTIDVYGFSAGDAVGPGIEQEMNYKWSTRGDGGTDLFFAASGSAADATNPQRAYLNLHDFGNFSKANFDWSGPFNSEACSTTYSDESAAPGVQACSPPPAPLFPELVASPPPPTSKPVTVPSPVVVASTPRPSPTPVVLASTPTPSPASIFVASTASPSSLPVTPPPHSGSGMGVAIGGVAAGAVILGGGAGAYVFMKRRRARAQEAAVQREQNVQMGAPEPTPNVVAPVGEHGAPEQDFEYTV